MSPVGVHKQGDTAYSSYTSGRRKDTHSQSTSAALVRDPTRLASSPADWMSQLYDREAGEVLGLYMPLRYAPMLLSDSRTPDAG